MRVLLFSFLSLLFFSSAFAAKFDLDKSHTSINFIAPHLMISKVPGRFDHFDGSFEFDEKTGKLESLHVVIKTDSINTNEEKRDKHLRSPDFFDVAKFPEMTYQSSKVDYKDGKPSKVQGQLTIRGISKPVDLDITYNGAITDPMGARVVSFEAKGQVNRKDFGLKWNKALDAGGWVVGDDIKIQIEGEAKSMTSPAPAKK